MGLASSPMFTGSHHESDKTPSASQAPREDHASTALEQTAVPSFTSRAGRRAMSEMHLHCQACKKSQWLPEDCQRCSYCGSTRLWEIADLVPARITVKPVSTANLEAQAKVMLSRIAEDVQ